MTTSPLANPTATRELLEEFGLATKHRLGQNFLIDNHVIERICELAELAGDERVLEVGPGCGTLTLALLQEAADQSGADAAVANEASEGIQVLAGYTMKEAQIENLVTAKGYTDCVAFMGEDSISVVVDTGTGELTAEDVAKITDIAMTETGYPASGIKIMAAN